MQHEDIENLATILNNSGHYRVTKKYQRPEYYNTGDEDDKMIAVFLDIEAAYAGLTPKHRLSGSSLKGKSRISKIGSGILRKALYFPAVAAKRHNPVIKLFCDKLDEKGKNIMAIICAAMRKLIHIIYGVLKSKKPFDKNLITT